MARVTMRDVARAAGVSPATVSRALRNDRRLSEATRTRVRKVAVRLGYRVNALVSAYQAHVRSGRSVGYQATLAWIDDQPRPGLWERTPWLADYLRGARRRAAELGYRVEVVRLEELRDEAPDRNVRRFARVLESRGIQGAILPLLTRPSLIAGEWPCAVVELGSREIALETAPNRELPLRYWHKVVPDYFHNVHVALRELAARGVVRPGLFLSGWHDRNTDWRVTGGFLAEQLRWPRARRVPPLIVETLLDPKTNGLCAWLDRWRPDAVLCLDNRVRGLMERAGWQVPRRAGLVHLGWAQDVAEWAGVEEGHARLGAAAVDVVVAQLHRNERGAPPDPRTVSLPGVWQDGTTLRRFKG